LNKIENIVYTPAAEGGGGVHYIHYEIFLTIFANTMNYRT